MPIVLLIAVSLLVSMFDRDRRLLMALLIATITVLPVALVEGISVRYVGIAPASPTIYTYTVVVLLFCLMPAVLLTRRFFNGLLLWSPFLVWLLCLTIFAWQNSTHRNSGLLHLCTAVAAYIVGYVFAERDFHSRILPMIFSVIAWTQLAAVAIAAAGYPLRDITGPQSPDLVGRATGLTAHPGELAKLLFVCAVSALALPQRTRRERWMAGLTLAAALAGISLTESRAVFVSVTALILIFVLLEPGGTHRGRRNLSVIFIMLLVGALSLPTLSERFTADPKGGARPYLSIVARIVIEQYPWTGIGPNGYVMTAGAIDSLTASGVPVHNAFLLSAAELGIIGASLMWLPFAIVAVRALSRVRPGGDTDPVARVVVSSLPGSLLIAATGWGVLQGPGFEMFALIFGYFGGLMGQRLPYQSDTKASVNRTEIDAKSGDRLQEKTAVVAGIRRSPWTLGHRGQT